MLDYDREGCGQSPIVVPFTKTPEVTFSQRVMPFDLDGDGETEVVAWPIDGGFLVRDRNGDGQSRRARSFTETPPSPV